VPRTFLVSAVLKAKRQLFTSRDIETPIAEMVSRRPVANSFLERRMTFSSMSRRFVCARR
jgi:hypothetical protein